MRLRSTFISIVALTVVGLAGSACKPKLQTTGSKTKDDGAPAAVNEDESTQLDADLAFMRMEQDRLSRQADLERANGFGGLQLAGDDNCKLDTEPSEYAIAAADQHELSLAERRKKYGTINATSGECNLPDSDANSGCFCYKSYDYGNNACGDQRCRVGVAFNLPSRKAAPFRYLAKDGEPILPLIRWVEDEMVFQGCLAADQVDPKWQAICQEKAAEGKVDPATCKLSLPNPLVQLDANKAVKRTDCRCANMDHSQAAVAAAKPLIDLQKDYAQEKDIRVRMYCAIDWELTADIRHVARALPKQHFEYGSTYAVIDGILNPNYGKDPFGHMSEYGCKVVESRWQKECDFAQKQENATNPDWKNWECGAKPLKPTKWSTLASASQVVATSDSGCYCSYFNAAFEDEMHKRIMDGVRVDGKGWTRGVNELSATRKARLDELNALKLKVAFNKAPEEVKAMTDDQRKAAVQNLASMSETEFQSLLDKQADLAPAIECAAKRVGWLEVQLLQAKRQEARYALLVTKEKSWCKVSNRKVNGDFDYGDGRFPEQVSAFPSCVPLLISRPETTDLSFKSYDHKKLYGDKIPLVYDANGCANGQQQPKSYCEGDWQCADNWEHGAAIKRWTCHWQNPEGPDEDKPSSCACGNPLAGIKPENKYDPITGCHSERLAPRSCYTQAYCVDGKYQCVVDLDRGNDTWDTGCPCNN